MLQRDLDRLGNWSKLWQLGFSIEKCKIMYLGGLRNRKAAYEMQRSDNKQRMVLHETVEEKDLGVWVTNNAKPSNHVAHAVSKANQLLGLLKRTFSYMDSDLMRLLFTSVIRPHLEYANVIWHPYLKKDIDLIERVQHRATKIVPSLSQLPYEERFKKINSILVSIL